uniref:Alpha-ketoglutarate-dependent dioxygenase AlkB-like domain-containing protein n=1 Tax=Kalanchoe fedtschenkoi TaxID=63787 RepID=A0A7N0V030_KALFE
LRRAEKQYKAYYDTDAISFKKEKLPREVDLSDVFDFKSISERCDQKNELPDGVYASEFDVGFLAFCFEGGRPGFIFIPGALSVDQQCQWGRESLLNFPQPPNRTNHNVMYGPIPDLSIAAKEKKVWSTLGLQFNWSERNYNVALPHKKIPDALGQLAKRMAAPAMKISEECQPEAAVVNYLGECDTLEGHLDDMEVDWSKPFVCMRSPRSCDAVLMAGEERECFHGVHCVFTNEQYTEIDNLKSCFSHEDDACF